MLAIVSIVNAIAAVNRKLLTMLSGRETKSAPLGLRVLPSVKDALENAAKDDRRSVAAMAELILTDWLTDKGYLKADG